MDDIDRLIPLLERKIRTTSGRECLYWQEVWEEMIAVYNEFYWDLHPKNPERLW